MTTPAAVHGINDILRGKDFAVMDIDEDARTFVGIASAEVVDTYETVFDLDDIGKEIPTMLSRGVALSIEHSDLIVGKIVDFEILRMAEVVERYPSSKDKLGITDDMEEIPVLLVRSKVYSDYEDLDDVIWEKIKTGKFRGLSIRGTGEKTDEMRCDPYTKKCGNVIRNAKLTAITLTQDGAQSNPLSKIIARMIDQSKEVKTMENEEQHQEEESRMEVCPTCGQPVPPEEKTSPPEDTSREDCKCNDEELISVSRSQFEKLLELAEKGKESQQPAILKRMEAVLQDQPPNSSPNSSTYSLEDLKKEIKTALIQELDVKRTTTPEGAHGRRPPASPPADQEKEAEIKPLTHSEVFAFYRDRYGRPPAKEELQLHLFENVPLPDAEVI